MASEKLLQIAMRLAKSLGANESKYLGKRSNINFLGKGPEEGKLFQQDINTESLAALPLNKVLPEIETSMSYASGGKLNDLQVNKLIDNMSKMADFYRPVTVDSVANLTDMASGTGNLTGKGLESLRGLNLKNFDNIRNRKIDPAAYEDRGGNIIPAEFGKSGPLAESPLMSKIADRLKNVQTQTDEASAIMETVPKNDIAGKTASSREFLLNALKESDDVGRTTFRDTVTPQDLKYITEGGGGVDGDPIVLVQKYFGPRVAELIPATSSVEDMAVFTKKVIEGSTDAKGLRPTDPGFDNLTLKITDDIPFGGATDTYSFGYKKGKEFQLNVDSMGKGSLREMIESGELAGDDLEAALNALRSRKAEGGRAEYRVGGVAKAILKKINKKTVKKAVDDIFETGDYKLDAELAAEALVENNPKLFGGKLIDDIDEALRSEIYGLTLAELSTRMALKMQLRRAAVGKGVVNENVPEFKRQSMKLVDGVTGKGEKFKTFETTTPPRQFQLNVEKAMSELNISREEAMRIAQLPSSEQKTALDFYLNRDVTQRAELMDYNPKKFDAAAGGRAGYYLGGMTKGLGALKATIKALAKERGMTGSEMLKVINPKSLRAELQKIINSNPSKTFRDTTTPEDLMKQLDIDDMLAGRMSAVENYRDMMTSQQSFMKNINAGKETPARGLFEQLEKTTSSPVPKNVNDTDIAAIEQIIKNMSTKKRKLNATGGLAKILEI